MCVCVCVWVCVCVCGCVVSLVAQTVKNLPVVQGDLDLIPESGRSPEEGNGYPLQYSYLENPRDRGQQSLAGCIVYGVAKNWTRLSD